MCIKSAFVTSNFQCHVKCAKIATKYKIPFVNVLELAVQNAILKIVSSTKYVNVSHILSVIFTNCKEYYFAAEILCYRYCSY